MSGQSSCRAGDPVVNKENTACVMYARRLSGDGGKRNVATPLLIYSSDCIRTAICRAGLIKNRPGLFVLAEPVLPPPLHSPPRRCLALRKHLHFIVLTPFQTLRLPAFSHAAPLTSPPTPAHGDKTGNGANRGRNLTSERNAAINGKGSKGFLKART